MDDHRLPPRRSGRTAMIAGVCLAAGVVIGLVIPRATPVAPGRPAARATIEAGGRAAVRNFYSPIILGDAQVRRQHLEAVETLERQCRATGQNCRLAAAARHAIDREQ